MKLNKEALETAQLAVSKKRSELAARGIFSDSQMGHEMVAKAAIIAYAEHPDSGLVERSSIAGAELMLASDQKLITRLTDQRDEARREAEKLQDKLDFAAEQWGKSDREVDRRGKQIAALREALEVTLPYAEEWMDVPSKQRVNSVLTDTAKAAEEWQKVPEGWGVYPVQSTEEMRESAMDKDCGDYVHDALGYYEDIWDNMIAAAPNPEAGEPSVPPDQIQASMDKALRKSVEILGPKKGVVLRIGDLTDDQKEYVNKLIEAQEKAYDPTTVIGGPKPNPEAGEGTG